jgi:hypothetical protein
MPTRSLPPSHGLQRRRVHAFEDATRGHLAGVLHPAKGPTSRLIWSVTSHALTSHALTCHALTSHALTSHALTSHALTSHALTFIGPGRGHRTARS